MNKQCPLIVDLDHTFLKIDLFQESLLFYCIQSPLSIFQILYWYCKGLAFLKARLAERVPLDIATLPHNPNFLSFLRSEKKRHRVIYLCTAANERYARQIAEHYQVFDEVFASDEKVNLGPKNKLKKLKALNIKSFDYAGDRYSDILIFKKSFQPYIINPSIILGIFYSAKKQKEAIFFDKQSTPRSIKAFLPYSSLVKNFLLYLPFIYRLLSGQAENLSLVQGIWGYLAFSGLVLFTHLCIQFFRVPLIRLKKIERGLNNVIANGDFRLNSVVLALIIIGLFIVSMYWSIGNTIFAALSILYFIGALLGSFGYISRQQKWVEYVLLFYSCLLRIGIGIALFFPLQTFFST